MDVNFGVVKIEKLHVGQGDGSESFVNLMVVDVSNLEAGSLHQFIAGLGGCDTEVDGLDGSVLVADDSSKGLETSVFSGLLTHQDHGSTSIINLRSVCGCNCSIFGEGRFETRKFVGEELLGLLISGELGLFLLNLLDDFNGLPVEDAGFLGSPCSVIRLDGELILSLSGDTHFRNNFLGAGTHQYLVVDIRESIILDSVDGLGIAVSGRLPQVLVVGGLGHALHTSGNHDVSLAELDSLSSEHGGLHSRGAYFVNGGRRSVISAVGTKSYLSGRGLTDTSLENHSHENFLDIGGVDFGAGEGSLGGDGTEMRGREVAQGAHEGSNGSTLGSDDNHVCA